MKVSLKSTGPCRQLMKVEVPAEVVASERAELLKYYTKGVAVPGFRKGHAPKALVEKKFAKDIASDLKDRVVPLFYHQAIEQEKLKVVSVVDVSELEIADGEPLRFEVTIDVPPEFKLPKYEGISIKAEKTDVSEKQVDETVETILRQHSTYEDVEGRAAREKDLVQVSYESTVDGQPLEEKVPQARGMGRGNGYWISCDDESFLPGMGKALIGTKCGDRKEVTVKFPEDFIVKELGGLKALFKVEVTGMREMKLPELNEEFFKRLRVESEAELRKNIREHMEESATTREKNRQQDEICEYLLGKAKLDVPESDVKEQTRNEMYDLARQRMYRGMSQEQIAADGDKLLEEARTKAERAVRLRYIMAAIADAENIQVGEQEISDEIVRMAVSQRRDAAELRKSIEKDGDIGAIRDSIRFEKTMDVVHSKAKVK